VYSDPRLRYVVLAFGTIVAGLTVHWDAYGLNAVLRDVLGDALWAAMMVWWVSAVAPRASLRVRAGTALAFSFAVEASQLYHAPSLDALRRTNAGHLLLGSGFDPRDLAAYTVGVLAAAALDRVLIGAARRETHGAMR
jgi:hypothetical protein